MTEQTEEPREPVQPAQTQNPTQSPEDVMLRLAGVPKTAEELEAEREAIEEERQGRFAESRQPAPGTEPGPQPGPTEPALGEEQVQPQQQPPPPPEPEPNPTP